MDGNSVNPSCGKGLFREYAMVCRQVTKDGGDFDVVLEADR